ncbi:MAG TPA: hypothetical protein VG123_33935, partial [Streptosporangiaceae bacterium]|nr:hypothetical protein [Streptosporangiaceae bacterium]
MTGRQLLRNRRAGVAITGVAGALCLLVTACSGSSSPGAAKGHTGSQGGGTTTVANEGAAVAITPANGSTHVKTDKGISVTVTHGKIQNVTVADGHTGAPGAFTGQTNTAWHTLWPLRTGA